MSTDSGVNSSLLKNNSSNNDSSVVAKLRRLKIQEGIITQNIYKHLLKEYDSELSILNTKKSKMFKSNVRNNFTEIKNIFESLKTNTAHQDVLEDCGKRPLQHIDNFI